MLDNAVTWATVRVDIDAPRGSKPGALCVASEVTMASTPARYGRNTRAYRRAAKRCIAANPVCWICGHEIDPTLPYTDRMAGTADHVDPLAGGGHVLGELRPAHRGCNSSRGDGTKRSAATTPTPRSGAW